MESAVEEHIECLVLVEADSRADVEENERGARGWLGGSLGSGVAQRMDASSRERLATAGCRFPSVEETEFSFRRLSEAGVTDGEAAKRQRIGLQEELRWLDLVMEADSAAVYASEAELSRMRHPPPPDPYPRADLIESGEGCAGEEEAEAEEEEDDG
eukprot:Hpha_TRINITY_DN4571_c0_g1::TRINITY_DN4571_c0_g1_i1::g.115465::m.115465